MDRGRGTRRDDGIAAARDLAAGRLEDAREDGLERPGEAPGTREEVLARLRAQAVSV